MIRSACRCLIVMVITSLTAVLSAAASDPFQDESRAYVIVHRAELAEAARAWGSYRAERGWTPRFIAVPDSFEGDVAAGWIREALRHAYRESAPRSPRHFAILLLGDAEGSAGLPTWRREQFDPTIADHRDTHYATDQPYQVLTNDRLPVVPLGRLPVRTHDEAMLILDKTRRAEAHQSETPAPDHLAYLAGEGRFGPLDRLLEWMFLAMIERIVPIAFDLSMVYAHPTSPYCPPPDHLTEAALEALSRPALAFKYVGHGGATGLDALEWSGGSVPMLNNTLLNGLADRNAVPGVALLNCCSTGWFDLGEHRRSFAEALLLHPDGPAAVIAGSRPTHPYANTLQQKNLSLALLVERLPTIGEADLFAARQLAERDAFDRQIDAMALPLARLMRWPTSLAEHRRMHMELYNLLGDPAFELHHPRGRIEALSATRRENRIIVEAHLPGLKSGRGEVLIETARDAFAGNEPLEPIARRDDPEFPRKAALNFPRTRSRVLERLLLEVDGDRLFITIREDDMDPSAAIIRIRLAGEDREGRPWDAFDAVLIPPAIVPKPDH